MSNLVYEIIHFLVNKLSNNLIIFLISMLPLLEIRGGLLAASILQVPYFEALIICLIGNILPIPFILIFINRIILILEKFSMTKKIALFLRNKAEKNKTVIDKYGYLGLALFVGIPLPGTGAWTGALIASVLRFDIKKSIISIILGILIATIIMTIISYGIVASLIK